jgi:16S rRNA (guanine527-N7)-methyltransferase
MKDPIFGPYLELLFRWNRAHNLTAFEGEGEAMREGVAPSLLAEPHLPRGARLLDVGSGGGFPAVPLLLVRPDLRATLCEPSHAKAAFLREAGALLKLSLRVEAKTVEAFLRSSGERWDAVTVRGVRLRKGLLKQLASVLSPGGVLLIWSGGDRAGQYEEWLRGCGLEVVCVPAGAGTQLLAGAVPRGT